VAAFQATFSIGEVVTILGMVAAILANYFGVIRRLDRVVVRHDALVNQVNELRHGRGLVLGSQSDWPPMVRRCFGFNKVDS
jgi:hypothetical protein